MKAKSERRSPLRRPPVRVAGQSLEDAIHNYLEDKAYPKVMLAVFLSAIAAMDWWRWYWNAPPRPLLATVLALIFGAWFVIWLPFHRKRLRAMRQGLDGERAVAEYLDRFRERGYYVFHDIPGEGFNVDHVLIGSTGVYTLETKTVSKPARGQCKVTFDGEFVRVGDHKPDRARSSRPRPKRVGSLICWGSRAGERFPCSPWSSTRAGWWPSSPRVRRCGFSRPRFSKVSSTTSTRSSPRRTSGLWRGR
jgi:hypothetical protein